MIIAKKTITIITIAYLLYGCSVKQNSQHNISIVVIQTYQNEDIYPDFVNADNILSSASNNYNTNDTTKSISDTSNSTLEKDFNAGREQIKKKTKNEHVLLSGISPMIFRDTDGNFRLSPSCFLGYAKNTDTLRIDKYLSLQNVRPLFPSGIIFKWVHSWPPDKEIFFLVGCPHNTDSLFLDTLDIKTISILQNGLTPVKPWIFRIFDTWTDNSKYQVVIYLNSYGLNKLKRFINSGTDFLVSIKLNEKIYFTSLTINNLSMSSGIPIWDEISHDDVKAINKNYTIPIIEP